MEGLRYLNDRLVATTPHIVDGCALIDVPGFGPVKLVIAM
ncbi:hypothetical protein BH10PSE9_BH10PSE9_00530 [soil metagenome]